MSADLVSLFSTPPNPSPLVQGVITAWDPSTGENTVVVRGAPLTNLPVFSSAGQVALAVGDVVMCAYTGNQYAILGRLINAGDASYSRPGSATVSGAVTASFGVTTTPTVLVSDSSSLVIPAWATRATVMVAGQVFARNTTANSDFLAVCVAINGTVGSTLSQGVGPVSGIIPDVMASATAIRQLSGLTPGSVVTVDVRASASLGGWTANSANIASFDALAVFLP